MAFDVNSAIPMVRNLSMLLSGVPDAEIQSVLNNHAIPRIKGYLLSATNSAGQNIFYDQLSDIADSAVQAQAEMLVELVFDEPIISGSLRRVAAAYTAGWLILQQVGIIESQQKIAYALEKAADKDLDRLVKNQIVTRAVESAFLKLPSALGGDTVYVAMDVDPDTVNLDDNSAKPYQGAQEAGRITAIVNGVAIQAPVEVGDTAIAILDKLTLQFAAAQGSDLVNLSAAPSEGYVAVGTRTHTYQDLGGQEQTVQVTYSTNISAIAFKPYKLDNVIDVAVATLYLSHPDPENPGQYLPGIKGLIYGSVQSLDRMTHLGPYSAVIELHTGRSSSISPETTEDQSKLISDSLFFEISSSAAQAVGGVVFEGVPATGDEVKLTVGTTEYAYTALEGDSAETYVTSLKGLIDLDPHAEVTAEAEGNVLKLKSIAADPSGNLPLEVALAGQEGSTLVPLLSGDTLIGGRYANTTAEDGTASYRINDGTPQIVEVPAGTSAQELVNLIAQDLASKALTQRVLGAVRPSSVITLNGTPKNAPGLELVSFVASTSMTKLVFTLLSVPKSVSFGVVPSTLITQGNWDGLAKSVVIETVLRSARAMAGEEISTGEAKYEVLATRHIPTVPLQRLLDKIDVARRGYRED